MTQLYHLANNPLIASAVDRTPVGAALERTGDATLRFRPTVPAFVHMYNEQDRQAVLAIDADTTYNLSTATTGVGGVDEAVGNNRAYPVHLIATADGQTVNLLGVRLGTSVANALPAGYTWYSAAIGPCIVDNAGTLFEFVSGADGWYDFLEDISVLANGVTQPATTAVNLQSAPVNSAELVDLSVKQTRIYFNAVNAAAVQTLTLHKLNLGATYTAILAQVLANTAGYTQEMAIELTAASVLPATDWAYSWSGAPTGGLNMSLRAIKY